MTPRGHAPDSDGEPDLARDLAIDLGTVNVLVVDQSRGIVLQEPSVVAVREDGNKTIIVEVGRAAKEMYGRTPEEIEVMRPLRDGVIADYFVTQGMLEYFISKVAGRFHLDLGHFAIERIGSRVFACGCAFVMADIQRILRLRRYQPWLSAA